MTEPTDAAPLTVIDLMRVVMDADNETRGFALRGSTNWAAAIGKAVQDAVLAARAPTDSQPAATPTAASIAWNALRDATDPLGETGTRIMGLVRVFAQRQYEAGLAEGRATQPAQAQAGAVPLTDEQITAAAKKLAECMDYPWDHMPEQGRAEMRKHARAVIAAANGSPPPTA